MNIFDIYFLTIFFTIFFGNFLNNFINFVWQIFLAITFFEGNFVDYPSHIVLNLSVSASPVENDSSHDSASDASDGKIFTIKGGAIIGNRCYVRWGAKWYKHVLCENARGSFTFMWMFLVPWFCLLTKCCFSACLCAYVFIWNTQTACTL